MKKCFLPLDGYVFSCPTRSKNLERTLLCIYTIFHKLALYVSSNQFSHSLLSGSLQAVISSRPVKIRVKFSHSIKKLGHLHIRRNHIGNCLIVPNWSFNTMQNDGWFKQTNVYPEMPLGFEIRVGQSPPCPPTSGITVDVLRFDASKILKPPKMNPKT